MLRKILDNPKSVSFSELKETYYRLGGKKDVSHLCKFQLAGLIDKLWNEANDLMSDYDARNRRRHEALDLDMDIRIG